MKAVQDDVLKELKDKLKDQAGSPAKKPKTIDKPSFGDIIINGGTITIGGDIVITTPQPRASLFIITNCAFIYISMDAKLPKIPKIGQILKNKARQISRKFNAISQNSRQITRNPKTTQNTPQPHEYRHFPPKPAKSLFPPYISLLNTINNLPP